MDSYKKIEVLITKKYGKEIIDDKKSIGDFMLNENHAVNVKSNNVEKINYSPNLVSIKRMHKWVFEHRKDLSFIFVDYKENENELTILKETGLIPIESINWNCLTIEAQGYGVIQTNNPLEIIKGQTKRAFYEGFLMEYDKYKQKEIEKHNKFSNRLIKDLDSINW